MSRDLYTPAPAQEVRTSTAEQLQDRPQEYIANGQDAIERFANDTNAETRAGRHAINQSLIDDGIAAAEKHANNSVTTEAFDIRYFTTPEGHKHVANAMAQLNKAVLHARAAEQDS